MQVAPTFEVSAPVMPVKAEAKPVETVDRMELIKQLLAELAKPNQADWVSTKVPSWLNLYSTKL